MPTTVKDPDASEMGEEMSHLLGMSFAMFIGAFIAGYIPMCIQKSADPARMRLITTLGAGVLTGTALIVIIPEGIHMWTEASAAHEKEEHAHAHEREHTDHQHEDHTEHDHGHHGHHHDSTIGAALAAGFAFMLIVDKISAGYGHAHAAPVADKHSHGGAACDGHGHGHGHAHGQAPEATLEPGKQKGKNSMAMLGLIVHAAIDGVALGASTFAGNSTASALIFFAIMLHKAPASFGLTTFLASTGMNKRDMTQQLLIFSLAAPIGAFATFFAMDLGIFEYQLKQLAIVMLFSGGTFLFVATAHILPEVMHSGAGLSWPEVGVMVFGTMLPLFLNFEHGH